MMSCFPVPSLCAIRYGIALLAHFANFTLIAQNSIISITMVAMVNNTDQSHANNSTEELPGNLNGDQHEASTHLSAKVSNAEFKFVLPLVCVSVLHTSVCMSVNDRGQILVSYFRSHAPCFMRQDLSLGPGTCMLGSTNCPVGPRDFHVFASLLMRLQVKCWSLYVGSGD